MKDRNRKSDKSNFSNIAPASLTLTDAKKSTHDYEAISNKKDSDNRLWVSSLFLLVIIAASVVFILPKHIDTPTIQLKKDTSSLESPLPPTGNAARLNNEKLADVSPFQQAQEARQRSRSQQFLSNILELQEELEQKNIMAWGEEKYNNILKLARDGDAAYRDRNFSIATKSYEDTVNGLQDLLNEMEVLFSDAMIKANDAFSRGLSSLALETYRYALLIKPENELVLNRIARSLTLDDVLALITEGNDLQQKNALEAAKEKYQQALSLDKHVEEAQLQIQQINKKISDRNFNALMSEGYTHLEQKNFQKALLSFQQASYLKQNSEEIISALNQTKTAITNQQINVILAKAAQLEEQEKWAEAVAEYNKALKIDKNIIQAQKGEKYSQNRANLDSRLKKVIAAPHRLSDQVVYEETKLIFQHASAIGTLQPQLSRQLKIVEGLLNDVLEPVEITLKSDNMTDVTIYKIGAIGLFEEKTLSILPGNYIMVGTRDGYRDIRIEFTVKVSQKAGGVLTISAVEKIASK